MDNQTLTFALVFHLWIVYTALGYVIGSIKNRVFLGTVLGYLTGFIGVIIMLCLSKREQETVYTPFQKQIFAILAILAGFFGTILCFCF